MTTEPQGSPSRGASDDRASFIERTISIDNPLAGFTNIELNERVTQFVRKHNDLNENEHLRILQRGAQLARDKAAALAKEKSLSPEQRTYLEEKEIDTWFFGQSKYLKGSLLSACLAGVVQGWTQSAINGSNIGMSDDFNLHYRPNDPNRNTGDQWLFGLLTAIPFLAGGLLAPFIADPLQEHLLGRRGAIAVACVLSVAATVGQSFSQNPAQLAGCRLVTGLTLAAKASVAPLLTAEISPNHLRGNLLSTWQLSDAFGIFLGFAANLAALNINAPDTVIWRVQTATTLIPTIALLLVVFLMPESPRYLMKHGKYSKALESFTQLRPAPVSSLLAARDLIYAHFQLETESRFMDQQRAMRDASASQANISARLGSDGWDELGVGREQRSSYDISRTSYFRRLSQTFTDARSRRALVCASVAMIAQQLTGINTIAFLSGTLLNDLNASTRSGAWVGFGLGLCNFLFGLPAFWLLDRVGRASMLLLGFVPMFVLMLILASAFKTDHDSHTQVGLAGVFGILFVIAYSPTAGPTPFAISAEVFPLVVREVGHSIAVAVNFLGLGFVLLIFPFLSDAMGGYTASLSLFAALNLLAFVLCFLLVPETKDRTLEDLQFTFDLPTKKHIEYRISHVMPRILMKYLRPWADSEEVIPFHRWARPYATGGGPSS